MGGSQLQKTPKNSKLKNSNLKKVGVGLEFFWSFLEFFGVFYKKYSSNLLLFLKLSCNFNCTNLDKITQFNKDKLSNRYRYKHILLILSNKLIRN